MGLAASVTAAAPRWEMVWRQRDYWVTAHKRTWKGSAISSFVMPFLYVGAMGVLLGGFIDAGDANLEGATSYLAFVAPGLVAAHAMQAATGEVTWPVMGMIKWHRTYFAMTATPLAVADIVAAQLLFDVPGGHQLWRLPCRDVALRGVRVRGRRHRGLLRPSPGRSDVRGVPVRLLRDREERVRFRGDLPAPGDSTFGWWLAARRLEKRLAV